jgi:hypothetical protein
LGHLYSKSFQPNTTKSFSGGLGRAMSDNIIPKGVQLKILQKTKDLKFNTKFKDCLASFPLLNGSNFKLMWIFL